MFQARSAVTMGWDLFGYWDNVRGKNVKMRDDLVLKFVFLVMS
jgi:hypothetical protein